MPPDEVIARAVHLAERSAKPVTVEPGRYTVILEPGAVAPFINMMTGFFTLDGSSADRGESPYSRGPSGPSKIGLQILDRRMALVSDPWDPELPTSTVGSGFVTGLPLARVEWIQKGILERLFTTGGEGREPALVTGAYRLSVEEPSESLEEMIASTKRGLWVNRLSHVTMMNYNTLLLTGTTRDGTFLIRALRSSIR